MNLRAEGLVKKYARRLVVNQVNLIVNPGEIVGLLGPNGAGKTTCFYLIVGAISSNAGHIFLGDRDITALPMYRRARLGIGYLAQESTVFRKMSVLENVLSVLEYEKIGKAERLDRAHKVLEDLGVGHLSHQRADSLSGGETRRLEIARALSREPFFMLLDEPFAGVDPRAVEDIQNIIAELKRLNIGVLITDHNVRETLAITDRSYLLSEGKILLSGTSQALAASDEARRIYLGDRFRLDS
ncbi:MAG: LPS export ABC transporter ATP-binding protein [Gemmatimonadota bacterium]|nr:LPS export ABC transporter ATP-binding protein [Gemmatimonadota bacterium]MYB58821.1 LPS export ABC transporter ATP-binding protein [Gemmatimonadota bacterium]MYD60152.1 LPS export ABC transporter ATP-binding protein [Gemmatimonadota bacterium]